MTESIQIQSNNIGIDAGPFNIFSQVNGFTEAFETDITPLLFKVREEMGVPLNPLEFFRESGYLGKVQRQR